MVEQGTAEWLAQRVGKVTASRVGDVVNRTKQGKPYQAYHDYMGELIAERLSGQTAEHFVTGPMMRGIELEPDARTRYEVETGDLVVETGFIPHPTIPASGGSPDGLVGEDGIIEIKCPNQGTHVENLLRGEPDPRYIAQMQWNLDCTGRQWADFVSYDDRFPDEYQFCVYRIELDQNWVAEARERVEEFLAELEKKLEEVEASVKEKA